MKRVTVFDLPGEIRNTIYGYVLVDEGTVVARYGSMKNRFMHRSYSHILDYYRSVEAPRTTEEPRAANQLVSMSKVNRALRKECRGFFFSNNSFEVKGDYMHSHTSFLKDVGSEGSAEIATLNLDGSHFEPSPDLVPLLRKCTRLRRLKIRMHFGHLITKEDYTAIWGYSFGNNRDWINNGYQVNISAEKFEMFTLLPALQTLTVVCSLTARTTPQIKRETAEHHVKLSVMDVLQGLLKDKGVEVEVHTVSDAPWLPCDHTRGRDTKKTPMFAKYGDTLGCP
ncbi:hypothetical protein CC86DRAFT_368213 [Ophiobolus disseminans]|uniref:F-box domain-containing protein n=1 Tax=Ophiobolus disseminans TaxID=1469910 RepID=A0A6A7A8S8_9PLEO|nr:hypothetical protein CC86DRAFT_368213 [Ophiobolus disseminans]